MLWLCRGRGLHEIWYPSHWGPPQRCRTRAKRERWCASATTATTSRVIAPKKCVFLHQIRTPATCDCAISHKAQCWGNTASKRLEKKNMTSPPARLQEQQQRTTVTSRIYCCLASPVATSLSCGRRKRQQPIESLIHTDADAQKAHPPTNTFFLPIRHIVGEWTRARIWMRWMSYCTGVGG